MTCVNYTMQNCAVDKQDEDEPRKKKPRVHLETVERDQSDSSACGPTTQCFPCCKATACNGWRRSSTPTVMAGSTTLREPGVAHPTSTERQREVSSKDVPSTRLSVTDQHAIENQDNSNSRDATAYGTTASSSAEAVPVSDGSETRTGSETCMPVGLSEIWLAGKGCLVVALQRYLPKLNLSDELLAAVKDVADRVYRELCGAGPPYERERVSEATVHATFSVIEKTIACTLQQLSVFTNVATSVQRSVKGAIKRSLNFVKKHIFGV